ncbi:MAG: tRNA (5-methylaminomethyl-2-thiouridine)(34)-methyltransferase MnmD [Eudoraea sp.]|uniref:tRNA (5-methylaminomethyl-2-thiouridine)(34)-methyltransferase MnmD n=1 Tax=Eudoraea sp. TaxID=1979955 RepID=UPI003C7138B4
MIRKIITTGDGSKTIQIEDWNEQYHSIHGAVNEAYHVFIDKGFSYLTNEAISILEIGFGTGLNALITLIEAEKSNRQVDYTGIEAYPITNEEISQLDYIETLKASAFKEAFFEMHKSAWESKIRLAPYFSFNKQKKNFQEISDRNLYDLIYFDAFGARVQPELWTEIIFDKMYNALTENGILVTYSAKGSVRRAMQAVGFVVERLPGPPGKREMLRALKVSG